MLPRTRSTSGRLPTRKNSPQAIRKGKRPPPSQRETRSRAVCSANTLAANPAPPVAASSALTSQPLASPPLTYRLRTGKKKRRRDSEDENSEKRLQKKRQFVSGSGETLNDHASQHDTPANPIQDNLPFASGFNQPLTQKNLAILDWLTRSTTSDNMERTITNPETGGRKRPSSQHSISADITPSMTSARSSKGTGTHANYRWLTLDKARVYVCSSSRPEDIQGRISAVVERETSEERKLEVTAIAQQLCAEFGPVLKGARREDDCVEPIYHALASLDKNQNFESPRKIDWALGLKPQVAPNPWDRLLPDSAKVDADEAAVSPSKRRNVDTTSNYADRPQSPTMPPPSPLLQPRQGNAILHTPRPDITMGLRHSTMVNTLAAKGIGKLRADRFLKYLQEQQSLYSSPSKQEIPLRFPLLVVEGKSYSTGKFVFEAQNQAAVSGSCMVNIQLQLSELVESSAPGSPAKRVPLAFSICTEGPYIELWVHYITSTDGERDYNMSILNICHASLVAGVVDFLVVVDRVLSWASSEFADNIATQLAFVERAMRL